MNRTARRNALLPRSPLAIMLAAGLSAALTASALAGPATGGQVVAGRATFQHQGSTTTIRAADRTIINYSAFNIGAGETVRFIQPSSTSRVLNRITGPDPSVIAGTLQSNGIVYIANPAGVYFANGALVDVGGIYAAAGRISNADFLANINRFTNAGAVENHGHIRAASAGVHLLGQRAANFGTIVAPNGLVTMTAGDDVLLGRTGGQIMARIAPGGTGGEVGAVQAGEIEAGRIAIGAGDMYALAVDHRGTSRAREITIEGGRGGVVSVAGELNASGGSSGGTIKVLGEKVGLFDAAVDASGESRGGRILIGGGRMGQGPERNSTATYISEGSTLRADATLRGKGGEVIVWSDRVSRVYGEISARGGALGGEGGFVETSSARELVVTRTPDVTAAAGSRGGTWLIDPEDLTIVAGGGQNNINVTPPPPTSIFESTGASAELGVDLIKAALTGGATVEVRTGATGPVDGGTITLHADAELDYAGTGSNTLSLIAHRDIVLDGVIHSTGTGDSLNLVLTANSDSSGEGDLFLNNTIDTGGGLLTITGVSLTLADTGSINTGGGNVGINLTGPMGQAGAGVATFQTGMDAGAGNITFDCLVYVDGDVTFSGHNITFNNDVSSNVSIPRRLTINTQDDGVTRFNGNVGAPAPLGLVRTNADGTTIFDATYIYSNVVDFQNPVTIHQDANILSEGSVTFASTLNSQAGQGFNLRVASPAATLIGEVGTASGGRLGAFTTDAGTNITFRNETRAASMQFEGSVTLDGAAMDTTGDQVYDATISLAGDSLISGANITFNNRINSLVTDRTLNVNTSGGGVTTFNATVGQTTPLRSLVLNDDGTTVINTGTINTSEDQIYHNAVLLASNTTLASANLTFHQSVNSQNGPRTLSANVTGNLRFNGAVGDSNALELLSIGSNGTTFLSGGSVNTVGVQAYNNRVLLGADVLLTGESVSFGRALDSDLQIHSLGITLTGNGLVNFNGPVGATSGFSPLASITISGGGTTRFFGNAISTTGDQTYNNAVQLGASSVTFAGTNIAFLSTIDATPAGLVEPALIVNTLGSGITTFAGAIGGNIPLRSVTTNAGGSTRIGANITTAGFMSFGDAVVLTGDATLREQGSGNITFGSSINSDGTARALTLLVDVTGNATVADPVLPRIAFGGDIGANSALRSLNLGGNRSTNPTIATIVGGLGANALPITNFSMVINTTQAFVMGELQKLVVLGNLTINAGSALIGDITVLRNLTINSPNITIRTRPSSEFLERVGNQLVMRTDPAVDIVAGVGINFSTAPQVIGPFTRPSFGTPEARNISATLNDFPQRALNPITIENMRLGTVYLDLRAAGPGNTNVAEAIAGATPRIDVGTRPEEASHGQLQIEQLAELGVQVRAEEGEGALPFLATAVHDDGGTMLTRETRITPRRLPPQATAQILRQYRTLFYGDPSPAAEQGENRAGHISAVLAAAWGEYTAAVGRRADPVGFRAYVEAVPAQAEALYYLNGLRDLFTQMGYLGLTQSELRASREEIVSSITFPGMTAAQLETAIMTTFMGATR